MTDHQALPDAIADQAQGAAMRPQDGKDTTGVAPVEAEMPHAPSDDHPATARDAAEPTPPDDRLTEDLSVQGGE